MTTFDPFTPADPVEAGDSGDPFRPYTHRLHMGAAAYPWAHLDNAIYEREGRLNEAKILIDRLKRNEKQLRSDVTFWRKGFDNVSKSWNDRADKNQKQIDKLTAELNEARKGGPAADTLALVKEELDRLDWHAVADEGLANGAFDPVTHKSDHLFSRYKASERARITRKIVKQLREALTTGPAPPCTPVSLETATPQLKVGDKVTGIGAFSGNTWTGTYAGRNRLRTVEGYEKGIKPGTMRLVDVEPPFDPANPGDVTEVRGANGDVIYFGLPRHRESHKDQKKQWWNASSETWCPLPYWNDKVGPLTPTKRAGAKTHKAYTTALPGKTPTEYYWEVVDGEAKYVADNGRRWRSIHDAAELARRSADPGYPMREFTPKPVVKQYWHEGADYPWWEVRDGVAYHVLGGKVEAKPSTIQTPASLAKLAADGGLREVVA